MSTVRINIETLVNEMEQYMPTNTATGSMSNDDDGNPPPRIAANGADTSCLISRVNEQIREIEPSDYEPHSVAIGPYFRFWDPSVAAKKELLHRALPPGSRADELRRYINEMNQLVDRAKRCYSPTPEAPFGEMRDDEEIACMLLLDGLFIVSWFVLNRDHSSLSKYDVVRDVVYILENQVPFFVLGRVYELVQGVSQGGSTAVLDSVTVLIQELVKSRFYATGFALNDPRPCHLLHLLHMHFAPVTLHRRQRDGPFCLLRRLYNRFIFSQPTTQAQVQTSTAVAARGALDIVTAPRWRTAVCYREKGVRLRARGLGIARSILDVELRDVELFIPCLTIDDETWTIMRNLIALEQANPRIESYVTAYCIFMSQLASRGKDVELLSDKGIIIHLLGSDEEVATGFSQLCKGIVFDINNPTRNYLRPTWEALEKICQSGRRRSMAWMRHRQCNNYAMTLALLAAVIVFISTVVQALFSVLSYIKQLEQPNKTKKLSRNNLEASLEASAAALEATTTAVTRRR